MGRTIKERWQAAVFNRFKKLIIHESKTLGGKIYRSSTGRYELTRFGYALYFFPFVVLGVVLIIALTVYVGCRGYAGIFQRMGALLIASGAYPQYSITAHRRSDFDQERWTLLLGEMHQRIGEGFVKGMHSVENRGGFYVNFSHSKLPQKFRELESRRLSGFPDFEIYLIVAGTLIAAFGDIFVKGIIGVSL